MKHWKTSKIIDLLEAEAGEFIEKIERHPPGGDVDTERLQLNAKGCKDEEAALYIQGFRTDWEPITDPSNVGIELIILTDGRFEDVALGTSDEATCVLYGHLFALLKKAGFSVVHSMKGYF